MNEEKFEKIKFQLNQLKYECDFIITHLDILRDQLEKVYNETNEWKQAILAKAFDDHIDTLASHLQIIHL